MAVATEAVTKKAICSHCGARCGVLVEVQDDRPVRISGDPDHPGSRGFICKRGQAAIEYFDHPGRLNHPLKRVGARGEGRWEEVSWDEALDDIAARLIAIREESGPEAIAYLAGTYHGTDQGIGIRLMSLFGSPNFGGTSFICLGPRTIAEALTFGFGNSSADPRPGETRCVLLWGNRPSASLPRQWGRLLETQRAGAKLVVIDPIQTTEAHAADLWLQLRPGTDAALAFGLLHVILEEGLEDRAFIERWVLGLDELRERVKAYPPERVAKITWLSPEQIRVCARLYAGEGPSAILRGSPNGMGRNAQSCERAVAALIALTGNVDRAGGNRLQGPPGPIRTKVDVDSYDALPASQRAKRIGADRFKLHVEGYERISEAGRRLWPDHQRLIGANFGAAAHPPSLFRAILNREPYPIRAMLIQHNNAVGTYPNARLTRDALASPNLELLVVHELFMTATAQLADYVLPASAWLEKSNMYVAGAGAMVLATPQTVPAQYERHSDYELCRDLGRRLGQAEHWPETMEALWDEMLAPGGLTFDDLASRDENWVTYPDPPLRHERPDPVTGAPLGFATPSHRVELAPSILRDLGYDPLPDYVEPLPETHAAEAYPFVLMSGSTDIGRTHQDHRQVASLRRQHPDPTVQIHPSAAAELGIAEGDWVWLESPRGRIRQRARLTERVHPRVVDAERWWYPERSADEAELFGVFETSVNVLTEDDPALCDPFTGSWPFRVARCRVMRVESAQETEQTN